MSGNPFFDMILKSLAEQAMKNANPADFQVVSDRLQEVLRTTQERVKSNLPKDLQELAEAIREPWTLIKTDDFEARLATAKMEGYAEGRSAGVDATIDSLRGVLKKQDLPKND